MIVVENLPFALVDVFAEQPLAGNGLAVFSLERELPAALMLRIAQEMRIVAEQMVAGRLSVDAAAAELDRRTDAILAKRRWMYEHDRRGLDGAEGAP